MQTYTATEVELLLASLHSAMRLAVINNTSLKFDDICKEIGYTSIQVGV